MPSIASNLNNLGDTLSEPEIMDVDKEDAQTSQAGALGITVPDQPEENWVSLRFAHSGREYTVNLADSDRFVEVLATASPD